MRDPPQGDGPDRRSTRVTLFLFATGIENSYPTIQNGRVRRDQMEECGHDDQWQGDFELLGNLNIRILHYVPPLHKTFLGQGRYDLSFFQQPSIGELE
jgi:beta-glucosidase